MRRRAAPHLLSTYSAERQVIAKELIDFDREWAQVISSSAQAGASESEKAAHAAETQRYFVKHGRYTAGTAARYQPSLLTGKPTWQKLAEGLRNQKTVSLNLAERKAEREQLDADRLRRENERRQAQGKKPFATLEELEKSDEVTGENAPDILLDRTAQIMGDIVAGLPRDSRTAARQQPAAEDNAPRISTQ